MPQKPPLKISALQAPGAFRAALVAWFSLVGRDYPWRRTADPYAILVSEVMLQQTRIGTVLGRGFYARFLEIFPNAKSLAAAEDEPLLRAWEGLGYYRRARMLRETARAVIARAGGKFPTDYEELRKLPGIGPYTAGALRAFAFDLRAVVVDGNVARVLSRIMDFSQPVDGTVGEKQLRAWAETLADPERSRIYHSALMELGQTLCRSGTPECGACPVASFCKTRTPEALPVKRQKPAITEVDEHALWLRDESGRLLLHREAAKRRHGLWKLPTRPASEVSTLPLLCEHRYTITRYRVTLRVYDAGPVGGFNVGLDESWREPHEITELPIPSPFRLVIDRLMERVA